MVRVNEGTQPTAVYLLVYGHWGKTGGRREGGRKEGKKLSNLLVKNGHLLSLEGQRLFF